MIRVGFILGEVDWQGGVNYYRNLLKAIQSLPNAKIHPVVFAGIKSDTLPYEGLAEIVRASVLDKYSFGWWQSKLLRVLGIYRENNLRAVLNKNKIDFVSHNDRLWRNCGIPFMGWIPDFQHVHLPHFFNQKELRARDLAFRRMISKSDAILLSSQNALNDLNKFFPNNTTPAYVLRFVPSASQTKDLPTKAEISERYGLKQPWFHLPNQFWEHKNHVIVVEALNFLKQNGVVVLVVATGSAKDYRSPEHFKLLMKRVDEYGLQKNFLSLGMVPFKDVEALMRYSIATINPSLFEGWSTTVEESKAIGKKILLSDIAVHREQKPQRGLYFDSRSAEDLAEKITAALNEYSEADEEIFQAEASMLLQENIRRFAESYQELVCKIVDDAKVKS